MEFCNYDLSTREKKMAPSITEETMIKPHAILVCLDLSVVAIDDSLEGLEVTIERVFSVECHAVV